MHLQNQEKINQVENKINSINTPCLFFSPSTPNVFKIAMLIWKRETQKQKRLTSFFVSFFWPRRTLKMSPGKWGAVSSTTRRKLHPWRGSEQLMLAQPLVLPGTPLFVHIWPPRLSPKPGKRFPNYNKCEPIVPPVGPFISDRSLFRWFSGRP